MGETLGRRENMASPGTRGKFVGVVLAEAEYITTFKIMFPLDISDCSMFAIGEPPPRLHFNPI